MRLAFRNQVTLHEWARPAWRAQMDCAVSALEVFPPGGNYISFEGQPLAKKLLSKIPKRASIQGSIGKDGYGIIRWQLGEQRGFYRFKLQEPKVGKASPKVKLVPGVVSVETRDEGKADVPALLSKHLALHRAYTGEEGYESSLWAVTHRATGLYVHRWSTKTQALRFMAEAGSWPWEDVSPSGLKVLGELVKAYLKREGKDAS